MASGGMSDAEKEYRRQLDYRAWRCNVCSFKFISPDDAQLHFRPDISRHPGLPVDVTEALDVEKELLVRRALRVPPTDEASAPKRCKVSAPKTDGPTADKPKTAADKAKSANDHGIAHASPLPADPAHAASSGYKEEMKTEPFVDLAAQEEEEAAQAQALETKEHIRDLRHVLAATTGGLEEKAAEDRQPAEDLQPPGKEEEEEEEEEERPEEEEERPKEEDPKAKWKLAKRKRVQCRQCGKQVSSRLDGRQIHISTMHMEASAFRCPGCPFSNQDYSRGRSKVRKHMREEHPMDLREPIDSRDKPYLDDLNVKLDQCFSPNGPPKAF